MGILANTRIIQTSSGRLRRRVSGQGRRIKLPLSSSLDGSSRYVYLSSSTASPELYLFARCHVLCIPGSPSCDADRAPHIFTPQFYFAALLYSFAHHLRRNTYRSLPLSRSQPVPSSSSSHHPSNTAYSSLASAPLDGEDYELEDESSDAFYAHGTVPGTPLSSSIPGINSASSSQQQGRSKSHRTSLSLDRRRYGAGGSVGSFADFVSAPPPGRRAGRANGSPGGSGAKGPQRGSLLGNGSANGNAAAGSSKSGSVSGSASASGGSVDGDVVFDAMKDRDEEDVGVSGRR